MFQKVAQFVVKRFGWCIVIVGIVLLVSHSLRFSWITVDTTTLILLGIILVGPYVGDIKKIKFGEFEAEIDPREVKKVAAEAEKAIAEAPVRPEPLRDSPEVVERIRALASSDIVLSLAKLRIELESRIRRLHERAQGAQPNSRSRPLVLQMTKDLTAGGALPNEMGAAIRDVMLICNRAIHGEEIRDADAQRIIEVGTGLLEEIDFTVQGFAITHPVSNEIIPQAEVDNALAVKYRLTTITPYVENPRRKVYELTRDELEDFFDGYHEFAEFVVRVESI